MVLLRLVPLRDTVAVRGNVRDYTSRRLLPRSVIENTAHFAQCGNMKRLWFLLITAACAAALIGCKPSTTASDAPDADEHSLPTQAQPKLPTVKLWIGAQVLTAEMALTPRQEQAGLMYRTNLAENEGMIFPFMRPIQASFWMKNTVLPLSVAYIAPNGAILELHDLQPNDTNAVVAASGSVQFVLETTQGWFTRNHIGVGTIVTSDHGPLHQIFMVQ